MGMQRLRKIQIILLVILLLILPSCKIQKTKVSKIDSEDILEIKRDYMVMNLSGEPLDLNPQTSSDSNSKQIISQIYQGLFYTENDELKKGIVDEYKISDDGLVYKFTIKNTNWSDGKKLTALDIKNSWMSVLNPENAVIQRDELYNIVGAREYSKGMKSEEQVEINVIDEQNLEVKLKELDQNFIFKLSKMIYYPYRDEDTFSGPFKLDNWMHHKEIELSKNDYYWNQENVKLDKVIVKLMTGNVKPINEFAKGNVDLTTIPRQELYRYEGSDVLKHVSSHKTFALMFNLDNDITKNKELRAKIKQEFPFEVFLKEILNDYSGSVKSFFKGEIIEEFQKKDDDVILKNTNGKIKILTKNEDVSLKISAIVDQILTENGIESNVDTAVGGLYYDRLNKSEFDIAVVELNADKLNRNDFYQNFYSEGYYNYYSIKDIDDILRSNDNELIQKTIDDKNYAIAISNGMKHYLFSNKYKNLRFINEGILFLENVELVNID
jgi:ABC-type oligopeptide transport system substrate-binding subunit